MKRVMAPIVKNDLPYEVQVSIASRWVEAHRTRMAMLYKEESDVMERARLSEFENLCVRTRGLLIGIIDNVSPDWGELNKIKVIIDAMENNPDFAGNSSWMLYE